MEPLLWVVIESAAACDNAEVGLEDRDWYREEPSKAWKSRWGSANDQRQPRRRRSYGRHLQRVAIAAGVAAVAGFAVQHHAELAAITDRGMSKIRPAEAESVELRSATPLEPTFDPKLVRLRQRPGLDVPARSVTRWTLNDPRFGRIEVLVPVGRTPREAFTVALAERGFQVVR
jgi:hypothetical protein